MKLYQLFLITLLIFFTHTTKTMYSSLELIDIYCDYEESKKNQNDQYKSWVLFYLLEMRFNQDMICVASNNEGMRLSYLFIRKIRPPFPDLISSEQGLNTKCQAILYIKDKILPPIENLTTFVEAVFNTTLNAPFIDSFSPYLMQTTVLQQEYNETIQKLTKIQNSQPFVIPRNPLYLSERYTQTNFHHPNSTN